MPARATGGLLLLLLLAAGCPDDEPDPPAATFPTLGAGRGYATSEACVECHPSQHASWTDSFHRTMTQRATPETIAAPFSTLDGLVLPSAGGDIEMSIVDGEVWVELDDPEFDEETEASPRRVSRPLVMLTGSHYEQRLWIGSQDGTRLDMLPVAYLIGEARWVGETDLFLSTAQGRRHTRVGAWTKGCFKCHATGPQPRTNLSPPDTRAVELGIACESCHGPAQAHVDARRAGKVPAEPLVVNPTKLSPERSAAVCGQCHANFATKGRATWRREGPTFRPGELLGDDRYLVSYATEPDDDSPWLESWLEGSPSRMDTKFWPDGSVLPGGREYSGMVESACFVEGGMTCNSCHSAHRYESPDKMLKPEVLGDAACTTGGCHETLVGAAVPEHSHHPAESPGSRCVNCHMPPTSWGMHRAVPSHRIDAPHAADVLDNPRPNACNLCHLDRTTRWTAQTLAGWYGGAAPAGPAERGAPGAGIRWLLSGHAVQRGLAAWAMGWAPARLASGADWMPSLLAEALRDPVSAVRLVAERALRLDPAYDAIPFDFTGDAEARDVAARAVLDVWRAAGARRQADPRVLLDANGHRDTTGIDALLSERDTRRIGVGE